MESVDKTVLCFKIMFEWVLKYSYALKLNACLQKGRQRRGLIRTDKVLTQTTSTFLI